MWPKSWWMGYTTLPSRGPHHLRAGDKMSSGPKVGGLATSALPSWGSSTLESG